MELLHGFSMEKWRTILRDQNRQFSSLTWHGGMTSGCWRASGLCGRSSCCGGRPLRDKFDRTKGKYIINQNIYRQLSGPTCILAVLSLSFSRVLSSSTWFSSSPPSANSITMTKLFWSLTTSLSLVKQG